MAPLKTAGPAYRILSKCRALLVWPVSSQIAEDVGGAG